MNQCFNNFKNQKWVKEDNTGYANTTNMLMFTTAGKLSAWYARTAEIPLHIFTKELAELVTCYLTNRVAKSTVCPLNLDSFKGQMCCFFGRSIDKNTM